MGLLFFYLFLALAMSFLCSIMEATLLSTTSSFIQNKEIEGSKTAKLLHRQKSNIDRPLSAILTINTIAHTIGAAGVGVQATRIFGDAYFTIISVVLTILILVLSEIIPKTLGANYWRVLALPLSGPIEFFIWISFPIVWLSERLTNLLAGNKQNELISRKEVSAMANIGVNQGVIEENESRIIDNLLHLRNIKVSDIMTPRTVIVTAPEDMKLIDFFNRKEFMNFSRIPVYKDTTDNITGYILKQEALGKIANDIFNITLQEIKRPIIMTYENITIPVLLNQLLKKKEHISVNFDEFGGIAGITTMEDIIETLLGLEITDETDHDTDMQKLAKEKWKIRARNFDIDIDQMDKDNQ